MLELLPQGLQVLNMGDLDFVLDLLNSAVKKEDENLVKILSSAPLNIRSRPEVWTLIHAATTLGNCKIVQLLLGIHNTPYLGYESKFIELYPPPFGRKKRP
jgi:hypothetical protein